MFFGALFQPSNGHLQVHSGLGSEPPNCPNKNQVYRNSSGIFLRLDFKGISTKKMPHETNHRMNLWSKVLGSKAGRMLNLGKHTEPLLIILNIWYLVFPMFTWAMKKKPGW